MDPLDSLQDVVRCTLCQDSVAQLYCEVCHKYLCNDCEENHLSDSSSVHSVVSLRQYLSPLNYPKCRKHKHKQCEFHCEQCDIPICRKCISSGKHLEHNHFDMFQTFKVKKEVLQKELQELEKSIYPKYQEIAFAIPVQKADLIKNSQKITTAIDKHGEALHNKIDTIMKKMKTNVEEMESNHLFVLNKQEDEIKRTITEITMTIADLRRLLDSNNVNLVSEYKSRTTEFRRLPPKLNVSLPNFRPPEIHRHQLMEQFGSLSSLSFTMEEQDYSMPIQGAESPPPDRSLMEVPRVIRSFYTGYKYLYQVTCWSDSKVWTCGDNIMMKLYNQLGALLKSVETNTRNWPEDITVTRSGDLVYTDVSERTVNIVKNSQIQTVIRLQGWKPRNVCSTASDDLLVVMHNDDKQTKVVCYSGFTEKQSIQYDDKGKRLYSSSDGKYISENRNLDICVSDHAACAVVVVNQAGKLRFTYTGRLSTPNSFFPQGIATDSQSRILVADPDMACIHILDQDGQFLSYIGNCNLKVPQGLCVDINDNLFVAEWKTGLVKKVQYYM